MLPLAIKNNKANNYFKKVLLNYIKSAEASDIKELYLFSHPHKRHLRVDNKKYETDVKLLINEVLRDYQPKNLDIYHHVIYPYSTDLNVLENEYFLAKDAASHPTGLGIRYIASEINNFILNTTKLNF